ncbi:hypothetical protein DFH06DRAFT_464503 [Mycena polygramma]|nr:hypothetical protein DFH06DRAFT_464503 [Mycena polygramma]
MRIPRIKRSRLDHARPAASLWHIPLPPTSKRKKHSYPGNGVRRTVAVMAPSPPPRAVFSRYRLRALTISVVSMLGHVCCTPSPALLLGSWMPDTPRAYTDPHWHASKPQNLQPRRLLRLHRHGARTHLTRITADASIKHAYASYRANQTQTHKTRMGIPAALLGHRRRLRPLPAASLLSTGATTQSPHRVDSSLWVSILGSRCALPPPDRYPERSYPRHCDLRLSRSQVCRRINNPPAAISRPASLPALFARTDCAGPGPDSPPARPAGPLHAHASSRPHAAKERATSRPYSAGSSLHVTQLTQSPYLLAIPRWPRAPFLRADTNPVYVPHRRRLSAVRTRRSAHCAQAARADRGRAIFLHMSARTGRAPHPARTVFASTSTSPPSAAAGVWDCARCGMMRHAHPRR